MRKSWMRHPRHSWFALRLFPEAEDQLMKQMLLRRNLCAITDDPRWEELPIGLVESILRQDNLPIASEAEVLTLIAKWIGSRQRKQEEVTRLMRSFRKGDSVRVRVSDMAALMGALGWDIFSDKVPRTGASVWDPNFTIHRHEGAGTQGTGPAESAERREGNTVEIIHQMGPKDFLQQEPGWAYPGAHRCRVKLTSNCWSHRERRLLRGGPGQAVALQKRAFECSPAKPTERSPSPPPSFQVRRPPVDTFETFDIAPMSDGSEQSFLGGAVIRNLTQDKIDHELVDHQVICGVSSGYQRHGFRISQCDKKAIYLVEEVIGKGRFGDVYSAVERASREPYALRIITRTGALQDLMQEAKLWRSVMDSKYIVQWYTIRAEGNSLFFLMEKCQCNFVRKLQLSTTWNLQKSRTAFKQSLRLITDQMLRAVEWIHSAGVVHRNIKASNFMCGGDKGNTIMKLTDFSDACSAPQGGKLYQEVGSWQYRSAEMHGKVGYTEKTDLWSFGVMAYALLFNEPCLLTWVLVPGGQKVGEFLGPAARFCRVMLRRNPDIRCSAPEALQLGFITGMACSVEMESDCSVIKKQDQPSVRELAPAVDWDPGSLVDSQFSDFTVCMTRKQLESLPLLGAGDLNGKHSAQLGGTLTSVTFDLELLIGEASKCGIRRCRLALLRNTHMLTEEWFDVSSKVPLRFYFSSSYFDKSSAYTVAVRWLRPAESVRDSILIWTCSWSDLAAFWQPAFASMQGTIDPPDDLGC
eukprot:s5179_g3.t1